MCMQALHTYNPSSQEAEAGEWPQPSLGYLRSSRIVWVIENLSKSGEKKGQEEWAKRGEREARFV